MRVPVNQFCLVRKYHFNMVISEYINGTLTHDVLLKYCNVLLYFIFVKTSFLKLIWARDISHSPQKQPTDFLVSSFLARSDSFNFFSPKGR